MAYIALIAALTTLAIAAPAAEHIAVEARNIPGHWEGRCFGTPLNTHDTDQSHDALYNWARSGPIIKTTNHNEYVPFQSGDVIAYACTDDHNGSNYFNDDDVDSAYRAMDSACPRYTASYAIYISDKYGATGKIIGKDVASHPVCQGYNGD